MNLCPACKYVTAHEPCPVCGRNTTIAILTAKVEILQHHLSDLLDFYTANGTPLRVVTEGNVKMMDDARQALEETK